MITIVHKKNPDLSGNSWRVWRQLIWMESQHSPELGRPFLIWYYSTDRKFVQSSRSHFFRRLTIVGLPTWFIFITILPSGSILMILYSMGTIFSQTLIWPLVIISCLLFCRTLTEVLLGKFMFNFSTFRFDWRSLLFWVTLNPRFLAIVFITCMKKIH